jgi:hypothetical protein
LLISWVLQIHDLFIQAIDSCTGDAGGAVVQQLMADLAAASKRAEEAEAQAAELEGQIQEF